jgi:hypothetical protein
MKKIIIMLVVSFFVMNSCVAQTNTSSATDDKFMTVMKLNLVTLDTAGSASTLITLANNFERIGNAEKKYWQPWYYAALCYGFMAANVPDKKMIDGLADKALGYLDKAALLSEKNSEISALKAMLVNLKILVDPVTRWQSYGAEAAALLQVSKEQNPSNPRPYLIEARAKLYTPAAFGGGPEAAKPIIEKALTNFAAFTPENSIAPGWGWAQAKMLLSKINGK